MQRGSIVLIACICLGGASENGWTETVTVGTGSSYPAKISFDDHRGQGLVWTKDLPCGANHASVTLTFRHTYQSEGFMPAAKVWLHGPKTGHSEEQWVAAAVSAPTDALKLGAIEWLEKVEGSVGKGPGYAPADLSKALQLDFNWTPDGVVTVNFGDNIVKHVLTTAKLTDIGLSVSWAKFEFTNLEVNHIGPADSACPLNTVLADTAKRNLVLADSAIRTKTFSEMPKQ